MGIFPKLKWKYKYLKPPPGDTCKEFEDPFKTVQKNIYMDLNHSVISFQSTALPTLRFPVVYNIQLE